MTTTDARQAFEAHVIATSYDPNIHLIYADWLEENGYLDEGRHERFVGMTLADPYNVGLRSQFAAWLVDHDKQDEANYQYWIVHLLVGRFDEQSVFTRNGPVNQPHRWQAQIDDTEVRRLKRRSKKLFSDYPEAQIVVVEEGEPGSYGRPLDTKRKDQAGFPSIVLSISPGTKGVFWIDGSGPMGSSSLCPYCGGDAQDHPTPCPHLVTRLTEWPPSYGGTEGGTFDPLGDSCLDALVRAGETLVEHWRAGTRNRETVEPARLVPVLDALDERLDDEEEGPYEPAEEMDGVKGALLDYLIEVFKEVCTSGQIAIYACGDRFGTEPYLLWASDAAQAAQDMARWIAEDVMALKVVTRPKGKAGSGRRPRKRK
jgi:uncharacterized protein (TIGR02996 family)